MWRLIVITFAFLGYAFWHLSGGSDYAPRAGSIQYAAKVDETRLHQQDALAQARDKAARPGVSVISSSSQPMTANGQPVTLASAGTTTAPVSDGAKRQTLVMNVGNDPLPRAGVTTVSADPDKIARLIAAAEVGMQNPAATTQVQKVKAASDTDRDIRKVRSNRVNLRAGPGTDFDVAGKLGRGDLVEVISDNGDGWVKLRVEESGEIAWMADFLLSPAD